MMENCSTSEIVNIVNSWSPPWHSFTALALLPGIFFNLIQAIAPFASCSSASLSKKSEFTYFWTKLKSHGSSLQLLLHLQGLTLLSFCQKLDPALIQQQRNATCQLFHRACNYPTVFVMNLKFFKGPYLLNILLPSSNLVSYTLLRESFLIPFRSKPLNSLDSLQESNHQFGNLPFNVYHF